jgi:ATP-binding cassette, subfamily B, bacterial PglK
VVVTMVETLGAGLIFVLLGLAAEPDAPVELPLIGDLRDHLPAMSHGAQLGFAAGMVGIFFVARGALIAAQAYAQHRVAENAGAQLSQRLMRTYLRVPYAFHLGRNSAELIRNAVHTPYTVVRQVLFPSTRLLAESLLFLGFLSLLVAVAPVAAGLAALVVGPAIWGVLRIVQPRMKQFGREAQTAMQTSLQLAQQSLHGFADVRLLGRERFFERQFGRSRRDHARSEYLRRTFSELPRVMIETSLVVFIVAFFGFTVVVQGTTAGAVPVLGLFAYAGLRLKPSLTRIVAAFNDLRYATAAIDDLVRDLQLTAEWDGLTAGTRPLPFDDAIELRSVEFRYDGAEIPALREVDLTINRGEAIGICGPTGGGKSTLLNVILGLLPPTSGSVLVDGTDIHTDVSAWHRQLGVVPQAVFLLDDTLRRNIALGLPDDEIDEGQVDRAVLLAQLKPVVDDLPDGLDTFVGERGVRLSGGQRQRIAIARALYRDPEVLILDEGTSALDNTTEAELMTALDQLRHHKTIIMVAHRLTSVRRCDRILIIENGAVSDTGTFEELASRNTWFRAGQPSEVGSAPLGDQAS